jgi:hypothetical protein
MEKRSIMKRSWEKQHETTKRYLLAVSAFCFSSFAKKKSRFGVIDFREKLKMMMHHGADHFSLWLIIKNFHENAFGCENEEELLLNSSLHFYELDSVEVSYFTADFSLNFPPETIGPKILKAFNSSLRLFLSVINPYVIH